MTLAVIIPTHNRWKEARITLNLLHSDNYPDKQIILIDDGSSDGTSARCRELYPEVLILRGDGNLWWSGAINLGVQKALELGCELILWLNDDNRVEPDTISQMVESHARNGQQSIICARTRSTETGQDEWSGEPPRWHPDYGMNMAHDGTRLDLLIQHPPGGRGVLIPSGCFTTTGLVDQKTFPHYWADHDFHYRAMRSGYKYYLANQAIVWNVPNEARRDNGEPFSTGWSLRFLFSRRSAMNLPTLNRLLFRHLSLSAYCQIYFPLVFSTLQWLLSGWVVRHTRIHKFLRGVRRIIPLS